MGLALAGNGSGWGGGCGGEEGPDNKGYIQGLHWSRVSRTESYSLSERPALARQSGPYKEMLFSPSQWGWDGALCPQDRAALVVGWGCHPPLCCKQELSSQWVTSAGSAFPLSPRGPAVPTHSGPPTPQFPGLIGGKEKNKTKRRLGNLPGLIAV